MTTLQVGGMTCQHCVHAVTKALQGVKGVEKVSVNLERGRAEVDGRADASALVKAVVDEGYEATLVGA